MLLTKTNPLKLSVRHPSISLRKKILRRLLPLMLLLVIFDSVVLHHLAINALQEELDADLYNTALQLANDVRSFSKEPKKALKDYQVSGLVTSYLFGNGNGNDTISYCMTTEEGRYLNGNQHLCHIFHKNQHKLNDFFFFTNQAGQSLRALNANFKLSHGINSQTFNIRIASTLNYRDEIANKILIGVVVPQLLLILISFVVIFFSVKKGLEPLSTLQSAIASRSESNLNLIDLPNSPIEVMQLTNAINSLMQRISNLISIRNRLIADAAHQLRTPLAGALAQLEVLEQETSPNEIKSTLPKVQASLDRLLHLVNQLLLLAKNQPDATALIQMTPIDINDIAKAVLTEVVPIGIQKNIDIGFIANGSPAMVLGNAERIKAMLDNLLDNAIRYTQNNGKITLSISLSDTNVDLMVADNGPGVAADELDNIFERFHRVVGSGEDGCGLGLSIVKEIASLHDATVTALSQTQHTGLKILVSFKRHAG